MDQTNIKTENIIKNESFINLFTGKNCRLDSYKFVFIN